MCCTTFFRRLPCPFCDKMFKNKYVLKYHVEGAHNQTLGDPSPQLRRRLEKRSLNAVTCFCGLSFETMNSYNEHMRTHQHHSHHHNGSNNYNQKSTSIQVNISSKAWQLLEICSNESSSVILLAKYAYFLM